MDIIKTEDINKVECFECGYPMEQFSWIGTNVLFCSKCGQSDEFEEE